MHPFRVPYQPASSTEQVLVILDRVTTVEAIVHRASVGISAPDGTCNENGVVVTHDICQGGTEGASKVVMRGHEACEGIEGLPAIIKARLVKLQYRHEESNDILDIVWIQRGKDNEGKTTSRDMVKCGGWRQ